MVHAIAALVLIIGIIVHIYAAIWVKGSIGAMVRGTVTYGTNAENLAGQLLHAFRDAPSVLGIEGESPEDEQVEGALREIDTWHSSYSLLQEE